MRRARISSVEIKNLSHRYDQEVPLFNGLDLNLPLGEMFVLQGGPGSGRSILLKILAGLVEPTSGEVLYNGQSIHKMSFEEFIPFRLSTAFSFDDGGLLTNKTLEENLRLGLVYHRGWRADRQSALQKELVESFELGPFLHLRPAALSSSVKKMAGLVRTFLHGAQIIFLDEPSPGLNENGIKALNFWINKARREGKEDEIIVIASGDEAFLKQHKVDHYLKLEQGKVVQLDSNKIVETKTAKVAG